MQNFRFSLPIEVRFADLDALGHLNNAKYLTYAEQARILYVQQICGWDGDWRTLGMILARTEIDYKLPIAYRDAVVVYIRTSRIGGKSFDLDYVMSRQRGDNPPEIAATIKTIMVSYDYEQDISIPVPQSWREAMLAYESSLSSSD
jgi:acyl-CoA thioester hydrolase